MSRPPPASFRPAAPPWALLALLLPGVAWAGGGGGGDHSVITHIALCMVAASVMGLTMKLLRQPLLLGYLLGGVLIGPVGLGLITSQEHITTVSEIGLILLLFMIGLEIDLKRMLSAGRLVVVTGLLQFPLSVALGFGLCRLLEWAGVVSAGPFAALYAAVAISLSSTMVVVKLLYDKQEMDTLAGRITVGILVFQDIWAILFLALQPNLSHPQLPGLVHTFGAGALLVAAALLASRYVLPHLFRAVAKVPELMLVLSLGWCFAVGLVAAHPRVGLSMEMGALIAGVALATFPYNLDVLGKVLSIRDFFITLFFVALGMQIPLPSGAVLAGALALSGVLYLARAAGVFGVLEALRAGHRVSGLVGINLAQMSEFALVILAMGVGLGHVSQGLLTTCIWAFSLLAVASTYQVQGSDTLARALSRALVRLGWRDAPANETLGGVRQRRPLVVLGHFHIARAFLAEAARRDQHLLEAMKVVDFNPEVRQHLVELGVPCLYGDVSHPETLHHVGVHEARVVVCTLPDSVLKGTTNLKLLKVLRGLCPHAQLLLTAETPEQARALYAEGADFVLRPSHLAGSALLTAVDQALRGGCQGLRDEAQAVLGQRAPAGEALPGVAASP